MEQKIIFSNDIAQAIGEVLKGEDYNRLFVVTDMNVDHFVMPELEEIPLIKTATKIVIKSGDSNKNLESLSSVWKQLGEQGATRRSIVLNIGGGVVSDLGGFAASTFKRGMRFVNVPTTLLAAVDAAVGGKTGVNFGGLKNEIGVFNEANAVIISTKLFKTLPIEEIKSGYAEMIKHSLLKSEECLQRLLAIDFEEIDDEQLLALLKESVLVKQYVVEEDPYEHGIRRALNLGHTIGHAFESFAMQQLSPVPHGYAVAWGLIVELILSHTMQGFDSALLQQVAQYVRSNYGVYNLTCENYDTIIDLMKHDKKSKHGELNFTLLAAPGDIRIDNEASEDEVKAALDIYRDFMGI